MKIIFRGVAEAKALFPRPTLKRKWGGGGNRKITGQKNFS